MARQAPGPSRRQPARCTATRRGPRRARVALLARSPFRRRVGKPVHPPTMHERVLTLGRLDDVREVREIDVETDRDDRFILPEPAAVTEKPGRQPGSPAWYITAAVAHGADKAGEFREPQEVASDALRGFL